MTNEELITQLDEAIDESFYALSQLDNGSKEKAEEVKMLSDLIKMREQVKLPCKEEPKEETRTEKILKGLKLAREATKELVVPVVVVLVPAIIAKQTKLETVEMILAFQRGDDVGRPGVIDGFSERLMNQK